jgi:hypothetical protein
MGKLLNEIRLEKPKPNSVPVLPRLLAQLSEQDRKDLLDAFLDPNIQTMVIKKVLEKRGIKLSHSTISRYRKDLTNGDS